MLNFKSFIELENILKEINNATTFNQQGNNNYNQYNSDIIGIVLHVEPITAIQSKKGYQKDRIKYD